MSACSTTLLPSQSGIVALGVSGVAVYFLLDYWLKSKYENRGALAEVRGPLCAQPVQALRHYDFSVSFSGAVQLG